MGVLRRLPPSLPRDRLPGGVWSVTWLGLLLVLVAAPAATSAHARWFTDEAASSSPAWDRLWSLPVGLALLAGLLTVGLLTALQRWLDDPLWPRPPFFQRLEPSAAAILGVQTAITMIFMASRLDLFVPNIELPHNAFGVLIASVAVVAAFSFITGVLTRLGGLLTIGLVLLAFAFAPPVEVVEQVLFVGIAIYLIAVGRGVVRYEGQHEEDRTDWSDRLQPIALSALRISAGISVLVLAFTEKLINVELGVDFLDNYPRFNVAREIGLTWFTDERFVYAVGIIEATAGFALLSDRLIRVVILALWVPFNLGIAFLPAEELIGHLPILSAIYVLLVRGTEGIPPPEGTSRAGEDDPMPSQRQTTQI